MGGFGEGTGGHGVGVGSAFFRGNINTILRGGVLGFFPQYHSDIEISQNVQKVK